MDFEQLINPLLYRLPLFLLWCIGIVIAVLRWKRHPRVSSFAVVGLLILLVSTFLATLFPPLLSELMREYTRNRILAQGMMISLRVFPFLDATGWICILFAIFSGRETPKALPFDNPNG
jgi:hypothetical protein